MPVVYKTGLMLYIREDIKTKLIDICNLEKNSMSRVVEKLIEEYYERVIKEKNQTLQKSNKDTIKRV